MTGRERTSLGRRLVAEAVGTALLLAAVVGSGIMGERLAGGSVAVALLANTLATNLPNLFGKNAPAFNVNSTIGTNLTNRSNTDVANYFLAWGEVPLYISVQIAGAFAGVAAAHAMFETPLFFASRHVRSGPAQVFSEFVATFGLLAVIWGCARVRADAIPFAVAAYITAAYWFTASTSFANPAVTLARSATDTFAGIRPADAPAFIVAQLLGAGSATALFRWLAPRSA